MPPITAKHRKWMERRFRRRVRRMEHGLPVIGWGERFGDNVRFYKTAGWDTIKSIVFSCCFWRPRIDAWKRAVAEVDQEADLRHQIRKMEPLLNSGKATKQDWAYWKQLKADLKVWIGTPSHKREVQHG